jgi:nucleoside-diphosphate-sugar epimerase
MDMAEQITGVPAPRIRVPPEMLKLTAVLVGLVETILPVPDTYSSEYLRVSAGATYIGDNSKARRAFGYNPRPLRDGLRDTLLHEMRLLGMRLPASA